MMYSERTEKLDKRPLYPPQGAGGLTRPLPSHNATDFRIFKLGNELLVTLI